MDDKKREEVIEKLVDEKKDYSLIERLELIGNLTKENEFKNFVVSTIILIEKSKSYSESASSLLMRKIYTNNIYLSALNNDLSSYGALYVTTLKERAIEPYLNLSNMNRRLISSIVYDVTKTETVNIQKITTKQQLLDVNIHLLNLHLNKKTEVTLDSLILCYNCVQDITVTENVVIISAEALRLIRKFIMENFISYLKLFLRPKYLSSSDVFPGSSEYVPEPFYKQIFDSHNDFMTTLNDFKMREIDRENHLIFEDILAFMNVYANKKFDHVGIPRDISLKSKQHLNIRQ